MAIQWDNAGTVDSRRTFVAIVVLHWPHSLATQAESLLIPERGTSSTYVTVVHSRPTSMIYVARRCLVNYSEAP